MKALSTYQRINTNPDEASCKYQQDFKGFIADDFAEVGGDTCDFIRNLLRIKGVYVKIDTDELVYKSLATATKAKLK